MNSVAFVSQLAEHCGVMAEDITVEEREDETSTLLQLTIPEEDSGRFIGHHGESLEAIQRITRLVFQKEGDKRLIVNINTYREDRVERLREIVTAVIERIRETGESHTFQSFLSSHERFVVHTVVSELDPEGEFESVSYGEGRDRRLTIQRKQAQ